MKQFIIAVDGTVNTKATSASADQLYGQYDKDSIMLHLSETECTTKAQLVELGKILDSCCATKAPQQVKQRSKNVIAFTLVDEGDQAKVDQAKQVAFDVIKSEAAKVNKAIKAANAQNGGTQQQTPPPKGGTQQQGQSGGQQQTPPPKGGAQQQNGGTQQQTPPPKGGTQQQGQSGGQQQTPPPKGGAQQQAKFDKTKDAFGRPLKTAYPGLFWPNMTAAEEEAACDQYWAMVQHVDKDIFHR